MKFFGKKNNAEIAPAKKGKKRFVAILFAVVVILAGVSYAGASYYQSSKLMRQADQFVKEGNFEQGLAKYREAKTKWRWAKTETKISDTAILLEMKNSFADATKNSDAGNWQACLDASGKVTSVSSDYNAASELHKACEAHLAEASKSNSGTTTSAVAESSASSSSKKSITSSTPTYPTSTSYPNPAACQKVAFRNITSPLTSSSGGLIHNTSNVIHYVVNGWSRAQVYPQFSQCGAYSWAGYTDWQIFWKWDSVSTVTYPDTYCTLDNVAVSVTVNTYLPSWTAPTSPAPEEALQNNWGNFISKLTSHENGHKQNGVDAANEIYNALIANHTACDSNTINSDMNVIGKKYRDKDVEYDSTTNHGATQGVAL